MTTILASNIIGSQQGGGDTAVEAIAKALVGGVLAVLRGVAEAMGHAVAIPLQWLGPLALPLGLLLAAGLATALAGRAVGTMRGLRTRAIVELVPPDEFDPDEESVSRLAYQLRRSQRVVLGLVDRPASSVRIRLDSVNDGEMTYAVELPERSRAVLDAARYDGVDALDVTTRGEGPA